MTEPAPTLSGAAIGPGGGPSRPAGIVSRIIAMVIDIGVVLVAAAAVYLGFVFVRLLLHPRDFHWPAINLFFSTTEFGVLAVVYLTFWWSTSGRTVGNALLGIRLVSSRDRALNWARALLRAVLCVIFPIGLLWVVFDPNRRRSVQDLLLRTKVVYESTVRPLP